VSENRVTREKTYDDDDDDDDDDYYYYYYLPQLGLHTVEVVIP
jgi:hypothetical protein